MLNDVRGWAKGTLPTYQDRKAFFEGIVNGEPDPIALLRAGDAAGRARPHRRARAARRRAVPDAATSPTSTPRARARMVDVGAKDGHARAAPSRAPSCA